MDMLQKILTKAGAVQLGLLRIDHDVEGKLSMQARAGAGLDENKLNCIINSDACNVSLLSKRVNLIQKDKLDYLYISCRVKEEVKKNATVVMSLEVLRACWFTRRSKGNMRWLQEKYIYDAYPEVA